jgi:hypothetical protein
MTHRKLPLAALFSTVVPFVGCSTLWLDFEAARRAARDGGTGAVEATGGAGGSGAAAGMGGDGGTGSGACLPDGGNSYTIGNRYWGGPCCAGGCLGIWTLVSGLGDAGPIEAYCNPGDEPCPSDGDGGGG